MIIALNLVLSIIALTHAEIYEIAFEPGDIDIITRHTPQFMIIALNLVI
jgi:hypothetical protein